MKGKTINRYKLVCGIGRNDYPDWVINEDGSQFKSYGVWKGILDRCYSDKVKEKHPTYLDCSMSDDWLSYSSFKKWYDKNVKEGHFIDKDLLFLGNKHYSEETCCSLPRSINNFFTNKKHNRDLPPGVTIIKGKYRVMFNEDGCKSYVGRFETIEAAHLAYANAKQQHLIKLLQRYAHELDERAIARISELIAMTVEDFRDEIC